MMKQNIRALILYACACGYAGGYSSDACAMTQTIVKPNPAMVTACRSFTVEKYQNLVRQETEQAIHQLYAAINSLHAELTADIPQTTLDALKRCDAALENLCYLFDPRKIDHNPLMNSLACQLCAGIEDQRKILKRQIFRLESEPPMEREEVLAKLATLVHARAEFFAQFMQWDVRLDPVRNTVLEIEHEIHAIRAAAGKSFGKEFLNWTLGVQLTDAQQNYLTGRFHALDDQFAALLPSLKDIDAATAFSLTTIFQDMAQMHGGALSMFEGTLNKIKNGLLSCNVHLLAPLAPSGAYSYAATHKSTLFPVKASSVTNGVHWLKSVGSVLLDTVGRGSYALQDKVQVLEKFCAELAAALAPEGSFEKQLDTIMQLAQRLKDEKAVVKQIAEQVQNYNIEQIVGFTDLMQKIAHLVQDVAKTDDTTWGGLLQKINPNLHDFLRSARNAKIGETLEAAREIAKTMGYKQPISQLALICARHGATIKLACEAAKPLVQKVAPSFDSYQGTLAGCSKSLAELGQELRVDAHTLHMSSLYAHDIAQALQLLAQTSKQADSIYVQYMQEPENQMKYQVEQKVMQQLELEQLFKQIGEHRLSLWEKQHHHETLSDTYEQAYRHWNYCMMGWLYQRLYRQELRESLESIEGTMQTDMEALVRFEASLQSEFKRIDEKRHQKFEPLCTKRISEFIEKAVIKHDEAALRAVKEHLLQQEKAIQLQLPTKKVFLRWNITNICAYIWWLVHYPQRYLNSGALKEKLALIQYQQNKLMSVQEQLKQKSELLYAKKYKTPDELCKKYLVTLHPAFALL